MPPRFVCALFAATLLVPSSGGQSPAPSDAHQITVTFWNVQWFPGRRPNASRSEESRQTRAVHADLARLNSDILALEEVRDFEHALLAVKALPGFKVDACSSFPPREGQNEAQQVAITSRLQPLSAWSELWKPSGALVPPRGFAFAAYQLAPGKLLLVYAVHLKSNRGEIHEDIRIREESMQQLLAHMKTMNNAYGKLGALSWIVGGDFNTAPEEPRFATEKTIASLRAEGFQWCWQDIPFNSRITIPADLRYPAASFDHIFFRNATLIKSWAAETSPQSSDHRAVSAILKLSL
ncbi:MAG TPA: endonuclease/exonuclease/phosphatase family protein [Chthoniobacterales bacterium]|jgi:endonuclease/exonuclease/phosphatase family metal-dependent hydrolase|nr:endonuclease/exonuclease/phosphatase family protein [Chthoniobacterales bacterium]